MCNWKKVSLSEVCSIFDGPHATPKKQNSGKIFLGISSLNFTGRINPQFFEYISGDDFKKWTKRVLPQHNDIVFSYETKLGTAALIPLGFECCLGRRMGLLRANSNIDARFLLYTYLSPYFQNIISENTNSGSTVDRIPLTELPNFKIYLPPLAEQKAIAAVLGSLDDKIDLLHRQNATLERMAETLFQQWFIEEAQEGWEECTLGDIVSIFRGASPRPIVNYLKGGDIPWIKIADATSTCGLFLFKTREFIIADGIKKSVEVYPGDLILSNSATCGIPLFVGIYGCIHDGWLVFRNFKKLSKEYIFFFLKSISQKLNNIADGSVQNNLNTNILKGYPIKIPPKEKLYTFNKCASQDIAKIKSNQLQIQTLEKLRDTLLPKLMSGEVRVRVDE